jgi:hypothetical protein
MGMDSGMFNITSVCREDILNAFRGSDKFAVVRKLVSEMSDVEMTVFARYMAEDYCEQLFWDSLKVIFEDRYVKRHRCKDGGA